MLYQHLFHELAKLQNETVGCYLLNIRPGETNVYCETGLLVTCCVNEVSVTVMLFSLLCLLSMFGYGLLVLTAKSIIV